VHEAPTADHHADVGRTPAHGFEEDEISRLDVLQVDFATLLKLIPYFAREHLAMSGERPLDQPAAIESRGIAPTIPVRNTEEVERGLDDGGEDNGLA
jgi:hypothetical protein